MKKTTWLLTAALLTAALQIIAEEPDTEYFSGPPVSKADDLAAYTGLAAADRIVGEWRQKAYLVNFEQLAVNYGDNVDFQLREKQILLTPQTADFLYDRHIPVLRYQKGSRPILEAAAAKATKNCRTTQEKALALMRFCRDLKKRPRRAPWYYGGTEEELIAKSEDLCETLGRLYVALCEISGIPARIVMHDIAGHITAEAYIDGAWGYIDPRFGVYFLKPDGTLASLRELMRDPDLTRHQSAAVKRDIGGRFTWEERAAKCRDKFFDPKEINAFEYYSLADAASYRYGTYKPSEVEANGLGQIGEVYEALTRQVFDGNPLITDHFWERKPLPRLPMTWRNDGFTPWWQMKPPVTAESVEKMMFSQFRNGPFDTVIWGTGPGSTFTHRTRVGEIFGYEVTDDEWAKMFTPGDRYVHDGINDLIARGIDPQAMVAELAHRNGLKILSRLEMNHEYTMKQKWVWHGFIGKLNKEHPEYRIGPDNYNLDFRHPEVRKFKLAILRELAQSGVDGLEVDFAVYPPFFAKPDAKVMTGFVRRVRAMLDEEGKKQSRRLELQIAVSADPFSDPLSFGLDWRQWMREKLIDRLIPGTAIHGRGSYAFDLRIEKFIREGKANGVGVYGYLDQSLRIHNRDPHPDGKARYSRNKNAEELKAQALMYMRAGVDGLHLAMATNEQFKEKTRAKYAFLGDPEAVEFADKNYIAGPFADLPAIEPAKAEKGKFLTVTQVQQLRIADDIQAATAKGNCPRAVVLLNHRALRPGEKVELFINGFRAGMFSGDDAEEKKRLDAGPIVPETEADLMVPDWWKRGVHALSFPAEKLWLGENIIRIVYSTPNPESCETIQFMWPEIQLRYPQGN